MIKQPNQKLMWSFCFLKPQSPKERGCHKKISKGSPRERGWLIYGEEANKHSSFLHSSMSCPKETIDENEISMPHAQQLSARQSLISSHVGVCLRFEDPSKVPVHFMG